MPINPTLVYNTTATNNVSDVIKGSLEPDAFGFIAVAHSSTKLAASSTVRVAVEGSYNGGTDWFAIETLSPADTDYSATTGDVPSWFRVIPVVPDMRVRIVNGGGLTYKIWISE